jgi:hypothetical protein
MMKATIGRWVICVRFFVNCQIVGGYTKLNAVLR